MLGDLISAGTSIVGGLLGASAAKKAARRAEDRDDTAIQRRVNDSLAAGIHPLFGLGASVSSSQPVIAGQTGDAMREAGQNIGRAVDAYKSGSERAMGAEVQRLSLKRMGLENTLIEEQIRSTRARSVGSPPPFPETLPGGRAVMARHAVPGQGSARGSVPHDRSLPVDSSARAKILPLPYDGKRTVPWRTSATSTAGTIEEEYGDIAQEVYGGYRLAQDAADNVVARLPAWKRNASDYGRYLARPARSPGSVGAYSRFGRR